MADIKEIEVNNVVYDIKDATARADILDINNAFAGNGTLFDSLTEALIDVLYPVGSVYISLNNSAPFSHGTWTKVSEGKALVGVDTASSVSAMQTAGQSFGYADSTLPQHNHGGASGAWSGSAYTSTDGSHSHGYYGSEFEESGSGTHHYQVNTHGSVFYTFAAGAHNHLLTVPSHTHSISSAGDDATNKNYQPSFTVYVWKRTA